MEQAQVDQRVQLTHDVPQLELHRGEVGSVCSIWCSPTNAYEVEFAHGLPGCVIRALLMADQIEPETSGPQQTGN